MGSGWGVGAEIGRGVVPHTQRQINGTKGTPCRRMCGGGAEAGAELQHCSVYLPPDHKGSGVAGAEGPGPQCLGKLILVEVYKMIASTERF